MSIHSREWYLDVYLERYHQVLEYAHVHPEWPRWAEFYHVAKQWAARIITDLEWKDALALRKFTACVAALSPMKPWHHNKDVAVLALSEFLENGTCDAVPVMGARKEAALLALQTGKVSGPKVEPFARALYGDRRAAVIDRHMLDTCAGCAPPSHDSPPLSHVPILQDALTQLTDQWRDEGWTNNQVTEIQAGIWGYIRWEKGLPAYDY